MASWDAFGDVANVAQLTGLDAVRLIGMIVKAANTARMHKKNCMQFAKHLKLIGNLLEQLKISELKRYPETREPLEQLEDALRRSYILVSSCQDRSYLYLLAMGWSIVYQFRKAQTEIDRYLKLVPLITLVDNARVRERLEYIEMDQHEYTLDDEYLRVRSIILTPDPCKSVLKKTLSCSYPNLDFTEALQKENEKLQYELKRSQTHMDPASCDVIQHLLDVTGIVAATSLPEPSPSPTARGLEQSKSKKLEQSRSKKLEQSRSKKLEQSGSKKLEQSGSKKLEQSNSKKMKQKEADFHEDEFPKPCEPSPRKMCSNSPEIESIRGKEEWQADLLSCCAEPSLCVKTLFCPCGTFAKIASVASNRHMTSAEACNELMAYSLILSCCCYTCCMRRKLRKMLNIAGGSVDDFLSHLLCCCCALVQEWREVEIRGVADFEKTKISPPLSQFME